MDNQKLQRPLAVCSQCGMRFIGQPHFNATHYCDGAFRKLGKRRGVILSRLQDSDWMECPSCKATGFISGKACTQCDHSGWLECRDKPWMRGAWPA